ncbi:UDP-N-acetylmuramoyl-L-alanyl-D-glutamate--2,6-diaminopimelate ligase [Salsipaludibacter albus]|uniref:UDP-N-acetylmuramoyl-L-alanyl-D-glutamate--2, 6-diaminopimelate ligase n=1 Tax=Salsipaludibacter albus TaxID=2849650 RepID=UPI001EE3A761|nr:UDP-N-acetylmuramoyl-L-alanyl-D-glutamate--2,6-diaminopimelate ligase [Salsipaludibacter albus]MBY5163220.1 UDP-N-acetylmuramoyl-L-alanyl-D-glutamate--2,6-diaminopimelate ligase [Salsipaludibacter albus]
MTTLAQLHDVLPGARLEPDDAGRVEVVDVTHDSRESGPGAMFVALRGAATDGHAHVAAAADSGAVAALVEERVDVALPQVVVPDTRLAAGPAAALVHGRPSTALDVVAITGTNGKTTTSYLVEAAAAAAGRGAGLIGTVATRIHGRDQPAVRTTPEGPDLQRLFARMRDRGVRTVAMEVSSHGLALHRVDGTRFVVAVFTNLSQDHLDFHGDLEEYFAAKARLFTPGLSDRGLVGVFDDWGRRLADQASIEVVTIGEGPDADVRLEVEEATLHRTRGRLTGPADLLGGHTEVELTTRLAGRFNLRNAAQAWLSAVMTGIDATDAAAGIAHADDIPGRFEVVVEDDVTALVDYAHSPDAITALLDTLRPITPGRIILVVGAGGDRDRAKRGPMGAAAVAADVVVFTSDNPRSESPQDILEELLAGATGAPTRAHVEALADREAAIDRALAVAEPGDVVVVAGKGHETGQEIAGVVRPFDDREVLARRFRRQQGRA